MNVFKGKFELPPHEVHLWHCRFDTNSDAIEDFESILSADEKNRAGKFKFREHREQAIISRGIVRTLLGKYLKKDPSDLRFGYTEFDKPFLEGNYNLQFNISHSGNRAVFGFVQNCEIGVDIEKLKPNFKVMDVAENTFSFDEIQTLKAMSKKQQLAAFYRCWTRKESFVKAKGSGLSFSLTSFSVSLDEAVAELLRTDWDTPERTQWQIFTFKPEANYLGAISVRDAINNFQQMDWETLKI